MLKQPSIDLFIISVTLEVLEEHAELDILSKFSDNNIYRIVHILQFLPTYFQLQISFEFFSIHSSILYMLVD